jgi:hypothetical protein
MTNDECLKNDEAQIPNYEDLLDADAERWELIFWGPDPESDNGSLHETAEAKRVFDLEATAEPGLKPEARVIWHEAKELHLIFSAIWRK